MLNTERPSELWSCYGNGSHREYMGWERVRDVRIGGQRATRYEVTLQEKHLRIILPMGGAVRRTDIGRKLVLDVYHERGPGERVVDHIV